MKKDALAFLDLVRQSCKDAGVRFYLEPRELLRERDFGVFDNVKRTLRVAGAGPDWWATLAHEFAHLCQWVEADPTWKHEDAEGDFDAWFAGKKKIEPRELVRITRAIQRCELDAERRSIRFIRDYRLGDVGHAIKRANFHVWQYEIARRTEKWVEAKPELEAAMPDELMRANEIGKPPVGFGLPA